MKYETSDDIPTGDSLGYHAAPSDALQSIQNDGLRPDMSTEDDWQRVNHWLRRYSRECPKIPEIPVDRNRCVYMFDDPSMPVSWVSQSEDHILVVVDRAATKSEYYCGEMGLVTEMIESSSSDASLPKRAVEQYRGDCIKEGSKEAGFLRLARQYARSVMRLESPESSAPLDAHGVEVFTQSRVQSDAIQGVWVPRQEKEQTA